MPDGGLSAVSARTRDSVRLFVTRRRIPLSFIFVALLAAEAFLFGFQPRPIFDLGDVFGPLGAAFVVVGVLLRSWAAGMLRKQNVLSTSGPYTFTRHPLYVGAGLMAVGFTIVMADLRYPFLVAAAAFALYLPKIRSEEQLLAEKFGERWTRYVQRTSRLIPRSAPAEERSRWSLRQWARNREYHALVTSLFALALIEILRRYAEA